MDREIEEFKIYTAPYIEISDNCTLKIDHTYRVMNLCKEIAISLNLDEKDIYLAQLCGLLHDIGRFEQWKRYETFDDKKSIDHGDLGVEILTTNNFIRRFIETSEYDLIILNSVIYHNKYKVEKLLSDREKLFCNIVRDADKIDILFLYTMGHMNFKTENNQFSDKIYELLMNKKLIKSSDRKTKEDKISTPLGFIFDINYKKSFDILKEKKYIDKLIDLTKKQTTNSIFINQLEDIRKTINNYIESR